MPTTTFDYKVRDADGRLVKGQLEADSVPLVAARLATWDMRRSR